MNFTGFSFGKLRVDGDEYEHDLVIDRGEVRKRHKGPSKKYRALYGHTPLSLDEDIPWKCKRLIALPTKKALELLKQGPRRTNAVLHLTC